MTDPTSEEYLKNIVSGTVMGAASLGIVLMDAEVREALLDGTPEIPGTARVRALVERRAREQGVIMPGRLFDARPLPLCLDCETDARALVPERGWVGVIWIREGRTNRPLCRACWDLRRPGQRPVVARWYEDEGDGDGEIA